MGIMESEEDEKKWAALSRLVDAARELTGHPGLLCQLAELEYSLGDHEQARASLQNAAQAALTLTEADDRAECQFAIVKTQTSVGDLDGAQATARQITESWWAIRALIHLAEWRLETSLLDEALLLTQNTPDRADKIGALRELAQAYATLGEPDQSLRLLALATDTALSPEGAWRTERFRHHKLLNLVKAYAQLGEPQAAHHLTPQIKSLDLRCQALTAILLSLEHDDQPQAQALYEELQATIPQIEGPERRARALLDLVAALQHLSAPLDWSQ